ncbi:hypothetical protein LXJ58_32415, partial [Escherichia coli]|nr:hypothetical protein [Escherichia coli]
NFSQATTAAVLNDRLSVLSPDKLATNADGRLAATSFFPDFSFRSPVKYRLRGTTDDTTYLIGSDLHRGTQWQEVDSNTLRRVALRSSRSTGFDNYVSYFSTPTLFRSIQNSLFI